MGSPVSPIVANLYMECFERKALVSAIYPPMVWYRFVDDTWVIQKQAHKQAFLDNINSIDPAIKFTLEGTQGNGAIPFLDTLVTPLADNSLSFKVYHKPTHTDQYLQWNSHHSLSAKYSVIGTLMHRAKVVCTDPELLQGEINHLRRALGKCKYPNWAINRGQHKVLSNNWEDTNNNNSINPSNIDNNQGITTQTRDNISPMHNNTEDNNPITTRSGNKATVGQVVIPYTKGIVQSIKQICGKYGIQVHFKGNTTIKQVLMKPKDQDPKDNKSGIIYSYQCKHLDCNEECIGETARTLRQRRKEHLKQASPIHRHLQQTGHTITEDNFNIIGREDRGQARTIKESIFIRVNNPTLNQNIGKYSLSQIWDGVLFNTPRLKLASSQQAST